ncbi:PRC-barrel domain-containing protein [Sphingomonas nostoxanthinifaciens]|uniref:PRC-barrel domain-containing protein n=1 Tax=Sphingomonas nostoxanthinifaciens TaxID=2872652 RepID=UPI001CC1CF8C|nr:PRC-barrel domain-containing protein [Sphingomonas nostoxanthinifaciens]UAK23340.1 PRC-barrel domain-containing protein [Sphingomonas nostoxanthinifaciens]
MSDDTIAHDETNELIASNKVEGTTVYDRDGEKLGTIHNFMVDKRTGQVDYAVLSFGGLFGLGSDYYPLPWDMLDYDEALGGYVVDLDQETLEQAPRYAASDEPSYDRAYGERVHGYYGIEYPA